MAEPILMKDHINAAAIGHIASVFSKAMPEFDNAAFRKDCIKPLKTLELKQRVNHVIHTLHQYLPSDFKVTAKILHRVKQHWHTGTTSGWSSFAAWPVIDYVGVYGIDHPRLALPLLKELTPLFSAEFAIRYFLVEHFDITHSYLAEWCFDNDEHVRRLVSEGSRPRLPWGLRLHALCNDPSPILPLLEQLNNDPSPYVRKSVANSLNDIAKDNPDIAINTCKSWQNEASAETQWIIRHATRSLVKAGNRDVLELLGYTSSPKVSAGNLLLDKTTIALGDTLHFSLNIASKSRQDQRLVIDYAIHHVKANGRSTAKVFKLKTLTLNANESVDIAKKHAFKKITTRQYYSGTHRIEILVNGISVTVTDFLLTV